MGPLEGELRELREKYGESIGYITGVLGRRSQQIQASTHLADLFVRLNFNGHFV